MARAAHTAMLITTLLLLAGVDSLAQPPRRGPGGGPMMFMGRGGGGDQTFRLLGLPEVQKELELVDDQKAQLKAVGDQVREQTQKEFAGLRDLSDEQRQAKREEIEAKMKAINEEARKKVDEILLPHQSDRLQEISLQVRGTTALADPQVQEKLGITEEQKAKLAQVRDKAGEQMRALWEGLAGLEPEARRAKMSENREKMQKMMKDAQDEVLQVLTQQQRDKFEEMKGKKIEIQFPQRERGGRDRRGPGGPPPKE